MKLLNFSLNSMQITSQMRNLRNLRRMPRPFWMQRNKPMQSPLLPVKKVRNPSRQTVRHPSSSVLQGVVRGKPNKRGSNNRRRKKNPKTKITASRVKL